ncbi:hypothetical protein ULMS_03580 [Patiriisocius marinistellae]|uniref:Uncharacterized protein n=1 Tax=Patiriisocius marinistellae TaxID=2494560 RepID=A0A5J4FTD3_9FLAO|nr:heparin lyase I family protein [Patiriisocius marinistellae]GEQ84850.1 hypothetical protein ULMS_03580 [Patiriisocius marinistellae]
MRLCSLLIVLIFFSCKNDKEIFQKTIIKNKEETSSNKNILKKFEDNFDVKLNSFWKRENQDSARIKIVNDPLEQENKVLKVDLNLGDYVSGGLRSEILIEPKDSFGYKTNYSFKFLLPNDFFKENEDKGWIIIHQWHDSPPPGFGWSTYKEKTQPPLHLLIEHNPDGIYYLYFKTGLKTGGMDEIYTTIWKENLKPNQWYEFSCEVLWSLYNNEGYSIPKLNGNYPFDLKGDTMVKRERIMRRNMYNSLPNYFKMGLYRSGTEKHNRSIYFDDFKYKSIRMK